MYQVSQRQDSLLHQKGGDAKPSITSSPSHNGKFQDFKDFLMPSSYYRIVALIFHMLTVFGDFRQKPPDQRQIGVHSMLANQLTIAVCELFKDAIGELPDASQTPKRYQAGLISAFVRDKSRMQRPTASECQL